MSSAREPQAIEPAIGRDAERATLLAFLGDPAMSPGAMLLAGEAGIGKTRFLHEALQHARSLGYRVLRAQAAEPETGLPYTVLVDLLDPVLDLVLPDLLPMLRDALQAASMRTAPTRPVTAVAVARAVTGALQCLAGAPLLIAIDDVQWVDPSSERALAFALRRCEDVRMRVLLTQRSGTSAHIPLGLDAWARTGSLVRRSVGPLGLRELDELVRERTAWRPTAITVRRLHAVSGGNPLYALEIVASAIARRDDEVVVPESLEALPRARLAALGEDARGAVLLVAAAGRLDRDTIDALGVRDGIRVAVASDVLTADDGTIRLTHPILGAIAYDRATREARRAAHARLAEVATSDETRALHLGEAQDEPDEGIAAQLDVAASAAAARGAPESAARLSEAAARLTPADDRARVVERRLTATDHFMAAGDPARARSILRSLIRELDAGPERAGALYRLADAIGNDLAESTRLSLQALAEAGSDMALRADIRLGLATYLWLAGDLVGSVRALEDVLIDAEVAGDDRLVAMTLAEVAHARTVLGQPLPRALIDRAVAMEASIADFPPFFRPSFQLGVLLTYLDQHEAGRPLLDAQLARLTDAGDESGQAGVLFRIAESDLRQGNWAAAVRAADDAWSLARRSSIEQEQSVVQAARALVSAHIGRFEIAREAALAALRTAEAAGDRLVEARARGALGLLELSVGDPRAAHAALQPGVAILRSSGIGELSAYAVVENDIEALCALGDLDAAAELVDWVAERGRSTGRSWTMAVAERGCALVAAGRGDLGAAAAHARAALEHHDQGGQPFERARTLLVAGSIGRRARRKREARQLLDEALQVFDALGAPAWSVRAADELLRIGGTRATGLTAAERRVAEHVVAGLSNKEIAAVTFLTVRTIETHLTSAYQKLGVRGRTALVRAVGRDLAD